MKAWLTIIGIGEDGLAGLGDPARKALGEASLVIGGKRHLTLAAEGIAGRTEPWPSPFSHAVERVLALRGEAVAVLASGDPFWFGAGSLLTEKLKPGEWQAFPALSSFALAAARLGWALQDVDCLSLCGRPLETLAPHLQDGRRCLVLSADAGTPADLAGFLTERGFGASRLAVLEALGGPSERVRWSIAAAFDLAEIQALNLVAVQLSGSKGARVVPCVSGLDDALFEHDGQITKREIRAVTLSSLAPRAGELLWDIGCGAGSIAIEWLLAHPANRAIAFESDAERAARASRNALALGVPRLEVMQLRAPAPSMMQLPEPDAIFLGGGVHEPGMIERAWEMLALGGRLVANAVTLESERALLQARERYGGALLRLDVSRSDGIGRLSAFRPAMTVTQWVAAKRGLVAGLGCRSGAGVEDLKAALESALRGAGRSLREVVLLAAPEFKDGANLDLLAERLGLTLVLAPRDHLEAVQERCLTRSATAERLTGLGAVAEAAALAVAGAGATLLGPRVIHESATCALARRAAP